MKQLILAPLFILFIGLSISAQKIEKPTRTPVEPTAEQRELLREGISFHDEKLYDEAIANYKVILEANKDCTIAMYELALTYYTHKQLDNALEVALVGAKYKSSELPLFYGIIANVVDDQGNPLKAIELYNDAIKIVGGDPEFKSHLSSLHYNLGVTYTRQERLKDARESLKKAVEQDFSYASPNYLLAFVFYETNYKIPALLAASRLVTLETNTARSDFAVKVITEVLNGNVRPGEKTDSITIFVDTDAPTDEGDFGAIQLFLSLNKAGSDTLEKNKNKTAEEKFAGRFEGFVNILLEQDNKKLAKTFAGKNYIPFFAEMKRRGFVKTFAYLVQQQSGNKNALEWLTANRKQTVEFLEWAKKY